MTAIPTWNLFLRVVCFGPEFWRKTGIFLSFSYANFSLGWHTSNGLTSLYLEDREHREVLSWLQQISAGTHPNRSYEFNFHYDLLYPIKEAFRFHAANTGELRELMQLRSLAQVALSGFLKRQHLQSEIRVWPHHFDTGAYATLDSDPGKAIGLGLAIPDTLCETHYFYISGYQDSKAIEVSRFSALQQGKWHSDSFTGAILPARGMDEASVIAFLEGALAYYRN